MKELLPEKFRKEVDLKLVSCESTKDMSPLEKIIGQERAVKALRFGLDIKERGFNIYVAGYPGTGRRTAIKDFLEGISKAKSVPSDWCYVNNFRNPYEPAVIKLPSGKGKEFQNDVKDFIEEARAALPKAFESEDYATKKNATIKVIQNERNELVAQLNRKAQEEGFIIQSTPVGVLLVPVVNGKPLSNKEIIALTPKAREEIEKRRGRLESELRSALRQLREMEKKISNELRKMNREVALYVIGYLVADLLKKYRDLPDVKVYIEEVQNDILDNLARFLGQPKQPQAPFPVPWAKELPYRRYEVNLAVDNSNLKGAPVIMEFNPTHQNLFGRIEKEAQFGALTTDFTMIRSGSLHRANGGYLVLPVEELLRNLFAYDGLKRALMEEKIVIEEKQIGKMNTLVIKHHYIPIDSISTLRAETKAKVKIIGISIGIVLDFLFLFMFIVPQL